MSAKQRKTDEVKPLTPSEQVELADTIAHLKEPKGPDLVEDLVWAMYRGRAATIIANQRHNGDKNGLVLYPPSNAERDAIRIVLVRHGVSTATTELSLAVPPSSSEGAK